MLYAILCYHDEDVVGSWSKEQDAAEAAHIRMHLDRLMRDSERRMG